MYSSWRVGPALALLAGDRLVLAVGLVGDDEGRALRAADDLGLDVEVPEPRPARVRHARGELLELLRVRVVDRAGRVGQPEEHLRHGREHTQVGFFSTGSAGHNGGMRVVHSLRKGRHWLLLILGGVVLALFPWTAYLTSTLPAEHVTHHWDVAWVGFDLFLAAALAATLRRRRSPLAATAGGGGRRRHRAPVRRLVRPDHRGVRARALVGDRRGGPGRAAAGRALLLARPGGEPRAG